MAVLTFAESKSLKDQGIKSTKRIEWVEVTAAASTTGEGAAYSFKTIKSCAGIVSAGPMSNTIDNGAKTVTFTPVATISGKFHVGLVEG